MTGDRYDVMSTDEGFYVFDRQDDLPIGEPFQLAMEARLEADLLNRRNKLRESVFSAIRRERARQDEMFGNHVRSSSEHLAISMKKLGDVASSLLDRQPRERELEQEVTELAAVLVRWLEDIERTR